MKAIVVFAAMLAAVNVAHATELYRWVDKDGVVHYGDKKKGDADVVRLSGFDAASGVDASLPYETRVATERFPVSLYVTENCADICVQARNFLKKRRVPFSEVVLKTDEDIANFRQKSGSPNVPAASVGRSWLKGFQPDHWNTELDAAGYPK